MRINLCKLIKVKIVIKNRSKHKSDICPVNVKCALLLQHTPSVCFDLVNNLSN